MILYEKRGCLPQHPEATWMLTQDIEIPVTLKHESLWDRILRKKHQTLTLSRTRWLQKCQNSALIAGGEDVSLYPSRGVILHFDEEGWGLVKPHTVRVVSVIRTSTEGQGVHPLELPQSKLDRKLDLLWQHHPMIGDTSSSNNIIAVNHLDPRIQVWGIRENDNVFQLEFASGRNIVISDTSLNQLIVDGVLQHEPPSMRGRSDVFSPSLQDLSEFLT